MLKNNVLWRPVFAIGRSLYGKEKSVEYKFLTTIMLICFVFMVSFAVSELA